MVLVDELPPALKYALGLDRVLNEAGERRLVVAADVDELLDDLHLQGFELVPDLLAAQLSDGMVYEPLPGLLDLVLVRLVLPGLGLRSLNLKVCVSRLPQSLNYLRHRCPAGGPLELLTL